MQLYEVLKPLQGDRRYLPGERVDASGWKWLRHLISQRYLRPVEEARPAAPSPPPPRRGRGRPRKYPLQESAHAAV